MKPVLASKALAAALAIASPAFAIPLNAPPPAGGVTLVDMATPGVATRDPFGRIVLSQVHTAYVATSASTRFTFALRSDFSDFQDSRGGNIRIGSTIYLDNVSIERVDPVTHLVLTGNLVANGDFEGGQGAFGLPNNWIYDEPNPAAFPAGGVTTQTPIPGIPVATGGDPLPPLPNHSFVDVRDEEYDALSQTLTTIPGAAYEIAFSVMFRDNNPTSEGSAGLDQTIYRRVATFDNGGRQLANGLDAILSATNVGPGTGQGDHVHFLAAEGGVGGVPEPASWAMMIVGFLGVGGLLRRRRSLTLA